MIMVGQGLLIRLVYTYIIPKGPRFISFVSDNHYVPVVKNVNLGLPRITGPKHRCFNKSVNKSYLIVDFKIKLNRFLFNIVFFTGYMVKSVYLMI